LPGQTVTSKVKKAMRRKRQEMSRNAHLITRSGELINQQQTKIAPYKRPERRPYAPYSIKPRPDDFTPLNTRPDHIVKEVYEIKLIPEPTPPWFSTLGGDKDKWCKYHKVRGHDTDSCIHLRQEIEKLIQYGKLRGYAQEGRGANRRKADNKKEKISEEKRHTLNTISGGGESSSSHKKYVRQVMLCQEYDEQASEHEPDISFTAKDYRDVIPHDDDPMVITLKIFKSDVKRVLVDPGSSADILYYDTFDGPGP
jgi:hypothetical protein